MIELCKPHFLQMDDKLLRGVGTEIHRFCKTRWELVDTERPDGAVYRYCKAGTRMLHRDDVDGVPQPARVCGKHREYLQNGVHYRSDGGPEAEGVWNSPRWVHGGHTVYLTSFLSREERQSAEMLAQHAVYSLFRYTDRGGRVRYKAGCRDFTLQEAMSHWEGSKRKPFINALKREFFNFSLEQIK